MNLDERLGLTPLSQYLSTEIATDRKPIIYKAYNGVNWFYENGKCLCEIEQVEYRESGVLYTVNTGGGGGYFKDFVNKYGLLEGYCEERYTSKSEVIRKWIINI